MSLNFGVTRLGEFSPFGPFSSAGFCIIAQKSPKFLGYFFRSKRWQNKLGWATYRVTRWVCKKVALKVALRVAQKVAKKSPKSRSKNRLKHVLSKLTHILLNNLRFFCNVQKTKLPKVNNYPRGENSPNPVTLATCWAFFHKFIWDRCYDLKNIFTEKFSKNIRVFCSNYC
jgi:hypothetical protein